MANLQNKTGRSNKKPPWFEVPKYVMASQAWKSLSPIARVVFFEALNFYNGHNNGKIAVPTRFFAKMLGVGKTTVGTALSELVDTGFLEPMKIGAFKLQDRRASEFRFTHLPCNVSGERRTNDFMQPGRELGGRRREHEDKTLKRSSHSDRTVPKNGQMGRRQVPSKENYTLQAGSGDRNPPSDGAKGPTTGTQLLYHIDCAAEHTLAVTEEFPDIPDFLKRK